MRSSLVFPPSDSAHFSRSFGASRVTSDTGAPRRRCIIDAEVRMHGSGLELALVFLLAAVIAVPVFKKLGLGAVLAYLAAGVVLGPDGFGLVRDTDRILDAAEIGVVMLLFVIGLELSPARLRSEEQTSEPPAALPMSWRRCIIGAAVRMHGSGVELALVFLLAAVIAVPVFKKLGLGAVLAYLAAGVVLGPDGFGLVRDTDRILDAAEIGVVMLLFVIGLELSPARLRVMRRPDRKSTRLNSSH